ncbi:hypothetical protein Tco_1527022, partial [Tanacetum coccineum]
MNEIGELRAISGHVLGAAGVQILQNNLDNLQSIRKEEDEATEVSDTGFHSVSSHRFCNLRGMGTLRGFDLLLIVEGFTPVEENKGLLVTLGILLDDTSVSANRNVFFLLIGVTETNFSL